MTKCRDQVIVIVRIVKKISLKPYWIVTHFVNFKHKFHNEIPYSIPRVLEKI